MDTLIKILPIIIAAGTAIWGIIVFNRQQRFNRLQNLTKILQRFGDTSEFLELFNLFDRSINFDRKSNKLTYNQDFLHKLTTIDTQSKLRFLVLLEEVALFVKSFEVDKKHAVHLFQWHFYYVYNNKETAKAFWEELGGVEEIHQPYWAYQKSFSASCWPIARGK